MCGNKELVHLTYKFLLMSGLIYTFRGGLIHKGGLGLLLGMTVYIMFSIE